MLVVATDLDGTLLSSDGTLSDRARAALRSARSAGIRVVLATARPARVVAELFDTDLLDAAICGNGAGTYDLATGRHTLRHPLAPTIAVDVMAHVDLTLPGVVFAAETGECVLYEPGYQYRPTHDAARFPVQTRAQLVTGPVVKLLALLPEGQPAAAWALLEPGIGTLVACTWSAGHGGADRSYPAILEISAPGVSKAAALAQLCAEWGVERQDVAAVGDAPNDLPMLAWAGSSYAVGNAHPEVLAAASQRLPSNDEDGVAVLLERLTEQPPRSR
jgi:Cof subfamily protein (haloacid dehalogenase superfamily)